MINEAFLQAVARSLIKRGNDEALAREMLVEKYPDCEGTILTMDIFAEPRIKTNDADLKELFHVYALDMLVKHSPDGDPWLRGETLDVIIKRIALLSERDYDEVKSEVKTILKEKHEKEVQRLNDEAQADLFRECCGFGGSIVCDYLEGA